jgi:predicted ATPase
MPAKTDRFVAITGGPGSGKSTLIEELHRRGHARTIEAGRGIIQDQVAIGGRALPWGDPMLFADLMLCWEMRSHRLHVAEDSDGIVFFDRGVPDVLGYLRLLGLPVPEHMRRAAETFRYNRLVFIAPPWEEIFHPDSERKQDFEEAIRTYRSMVETYTQFGYELIEIPRVSVKERAEFVIEKIGASVRF